jgi:Rps23 Pro-64 3,4-dihydroxylase Tpa1-like proline 4-hydroxylase
MTRKYYPTRHYDNCVNQKLLDTIAQRYNNQYSFGWKANRNTPYDQGHWNVPIVIQNKKLLNDISGQLSTKDQEAFVLWNYLKHHFLGERMLSRVYINGYTYGTDGYIHRDDPHFDEQKDNSPTTETVIIYLNKSWDPDWGGETSLFDNEREITKSILPKFGRMLIFDGQKEHASRPLSRVCNELRKVLVFKTYSSTQKNKINYLYDMTIDKSHSHRTFYEHLVGTSAIAISNGAPPYLIDACLFHSIYGTEFYKQGPVNITREWVKEQIGEQAERLVFAFCGVRNRFETLIAQYQNEPSQFYKDLLFIEYCNLLEQRGTTERTNTIKQLIFT